MSIKRSNAKKRNKNPLSEMAGDFFVHIGALITLKIT